MADLLSASRDCPAIILVNPNAGGGRASSCVDELQTLFHENRFPAEFRKARSAKELKEHVQREVDNGRRCFVAVGGDGTFQALVNATLGMDAVLGLLPAGGGNDFAAALGLPHGALHAASVLLRGAVRAVDLVRVRFADGRTRLYAGGGGVGLDAEAVRHSNGAYCRLPGRLRYIASALHALMRYEPIKVRLEFSGSNSNVAEEKALLVAVSNTPSYGAGLRLAPGAQIDDGLLDVVLIEDLSLFGTLALLPRLMGSGELRTSRVQRWRVPRMRLTTSQASLFHGDGEILGPTPVEIEVVPKAIQVLAPQPRPGLSL